MFKLRWIHAFEQFSKGPASSDLQPDVGIASPVRYIMVGSTVEPGWPFQRTRLILLEAGLFIPGNRLLLRETDFCISSIIPVKHCKLGLK